MLARHAVPASLLTTRRPRHLRLLSRGEEVLPPWQSQPPATPVPRPFAGGHGDSVGIFLRPLPKRPDEGPTVRPSL
jgi:hypothetical protein